ncbi:MAG: hypothetical protein ACREV8_04855, partial [Gammaproteobacteria bacterium]
MRRADVPADEGPDIRSLKGELDADQVALVEKYMGIAPEELADLGANSQRTLLAKAMEAQSRDAGRADQGAFQSTFAGGDERASPASRPNVPGDRLAARSEFEDQGARLAQDQGAADLNALRDRAAAGDGQAKAQLRAREATAKKAATQKGAMIDQLQGLRRQREALADSQEYTELKRIRDLGQELSDKQRKTLDGYDKQHERLGNSIFKLEGKIYDIGAKADLESVAASGRGDRRFRGFSKAEAEHAEMFEARAREKASKAEQEAIDRLEAEWAARETQRTQRDPRQPEQPQPKETPAGTSEATPVRDGAFDTSADGFVVSTNGNPLHFPHQRDAGWWILKTGNKQSARQVFEIANHPSGEGFTVRETHKADGPGGKQEGGAVAVRPESGAPKSETNQGAEPSNPVKKQEAAPISMPARKASDTKTVGGKRERAKTIRDVLTVIRSAGGIDPYYRSGIVGEKKGSYGNLFRKGGMGMDEVADLMHRENFLDASHMDDPE